MDPEMKQSNSNFGIGEFQNSDRESGHILSTWLHRSGIDRKTVLTEINEIEGKFGDIGDKSFMQWTSDGESSKRVSGSTPEIRGDRLIALVRWFVKEHSHRARPVMTITELRRLMNLYQDLPVKNRLQFRRLIHDLEIQTGERMSDFSFATDWKSHFAQWPVFCFVLDPFWCIRASTSYELTLAGYSEADMQNWGFWHRLTASRSGKPKYSPDSPRYSLRGPYSDAYYKLQLERFRSETALLRQAQDARYLSVIHLLEGTEQFSKMWKSVQEINPPLQQPFGIPVPFFREDGTLLWMLEVSTIIPNTPNYRLIVWVPLNEDSAEYQGEVRRMADQSKKFSRRAFFIEDYAANFSPDEKFAFGL